MKTNKKGFTLIELIMIIVILGILAAVAVPQYFDLTSDAETASELGVVGGVRAGIQTYFAENRAFPTTLGGGAGVCTTANVCFGTVLGQGGVTSDWTVNTAGINYSGPAGGAYSYTAASGSFLAQ